MLDQIPTEVMMQCKGRTDGVSSSDMLAGARFGLCREWCDRELLLAASPIIIARVVFSPRFGSELRQRLKVLRVRVFFL